jgi:hypothetical protein
MADDNIDLRVRLRGARQTSADAKRVAGSVDDLGDKTARSGRQADRAGRSFSSLNTRMKLFRGTSLGVSTGLRGTVGGALAAAGGMLALGSGVRFVAGEYIEAARVGAQTAAAIKSTEGAANVSADAVSRLAGALSAKAGIDDEVIQSGENVLLTFTKVRNEAGKGNDIFNQATGAALDMSVALGTSLKSSNIQLGKALNDPVKGVTALQRVGVSFTKSQRDQIKALVKSGETLKAQKLILREVTTEFGGSAAAQAQPIDKLRVGIGNLAESLGTLAAPTVNRGITALSRSVETLQRTDIDTSTKFRVIGRQLRRDLGPVADDLRTEFEKLNLGQKLADGIEIATPAIINAAVAAAPRAAEAFVTAFRDLGPWGKLLTVGLLASKLGAFNILGNMAGNRFQRSFRGQIHPPTVGPGGTLLWGPIGAVVTGAAVDAAAAVKRLSSGNPADSTTDPSNDLKRQIIHQIVHNPFRSGTKGGALRQDPGMPNLLPVQPGGGRIQQRGNTMRDAADTIVHEHHHVHVMIGERQVAEANYKVVRRQRAGR